MRPILFVWMGHKFHSYSVCLTASLLVFAEVMAEQISTRHWPMFVSLGITGIVMSAGTSGSRLLFVLSRWRTYWQHRERIWARGETGASLFGGMVPLYAVALPLWCTTRLPVATFLDMVALAALPALFVGRIGCILHGCCIGRVTTSRIGIRLTGEGSADIRRWPVAFLEMAALVLLGALARFVLLGLARPGVTFVTIFGCYSLLRALLDFLRMQPPGEVVSLSQKIALAYTIINALVLVTIT